MLLLDETVAENVFAISLKLYSTLAGINNPGQMSAIPKTAQFQKAQ